MILSADLTVSYGPTPVLRNAQFNVAAGEILGIVGQSGSGKSTLTMALLRLLPPRVAQTRGTVLWRGRDLIQCGDRELRRVRGKEIAVVLQAAGSALNPYLTVEGHFREAWNAHARAPWREARAQTIEHFRLLNLDQPEEILRRYPGQISIGQAQRVLIAMALLHRPQLLIMDEPTSALDFLARTEVLRLIRAVREETGVAILYISHDLPAVAALCDRVAILHEGSVVETGAPREVFEHPRHPATQQFAAALAHVHSADLVMSGEGARAKLMFG